MAGKATLPSSFRLSAEARRLLRSIAHEHRITQTAALEHLIRSAVGHEALDVSISSDRAMRR